MFMCIQFVILLECINIKYTAALPLERIKTANNIELFRFSV